MGYLGAFSGIAFLIVGIVQMVVGYLGIEYHLGTIAAFVAIFIAFFLRIMLPLTIGTFFGALDVLNWHWLGALVCNAWIVIRSACNGNCSYRFFNAETTGSKFKFFVY